MAKMTINVTPPFSEKDKQAMIDFATATIQSGKTIDDAYSGFTHDEAIALILAGSNMDITEAEFILAMARGELPDHEVDENGKVLSIIY